MRHDVRSVELPPSDVLIAAAVRAAQQQARGDAIVVHTPRLDDEGRPTGNREERRRAARILRLRQTSKGATP